MLLAKLLALIKRLQLAALLLACAESLDLNLAVVALVSNQHGT